MAWQGVDFPAAGVDSGEPRRSLLSLSIQLRLARWRRRARLRETAIAYRPPTSEVLRAVPFFAKWPASSLSALLERGTLTVGMQGRCVQLVGEPARAAAVLVVLSGRLTEVPNKADLARCAAEVPALAHSREPRTGPLVFPGLFGPSCEAAALTTTPALGQAQERVLDGLAAYTAGGVVGLSTLVLGGGVQRSVRCQTPAVLFSIPAAAVVDALRQQSAEAQRTAVAAAAAAVAGQLRALDDRPSPQCLLRENPVMRGLADATVKGAWRVLHPAVLRAGDTLAGDCLRADVVYFLGRGEVELREGGARRRVSARGSAVGLSSVLPHEVPRSAPGACVSARAATYCEVWGVAADDLRRLCTPGDMESCARAAARWWASRPVPHAAAILRQVPAFCTASEGAMSALCSALEVRVLPAGAALTPAAGKPLKGGVAVLAGRCARVEPAGDAACRHDGERRTPVQPGAPLFFCEALARRTSPALVVAESGAVVAFGSAARLVDAMEETGCAPAEVQAILDAATATADGNAGLGDAARALAPGQETAIQRVAQRKLDLLRQRAREREAQRREAAALTADEQQRQALELQNEVTVSLALRLRFLHPSADAIASDDYLHRITGAVGGGNTAGTATAPLPSPREGSQHQQPYRPRTCFTIDTAGDIVFSETYPPRDVREERSHGEQPQSSTASPVLERARAHAGEQPASNPLPPPLAPPQRSGLLPTQPNSRNSRAGAAVPTAARTFPFSAPPSLQRAPAAAPPPADAVCPQHLRTALRPPEHVNRYGPPKRVPPRLAAMRQAVSALKDEADGFDQRKERLFKLSQLHTPH